MRFITQLTVSIVFIVCFFAVIPAYSQGNEPKARHYEEDILSMRQRVRLMQSWWKKKKEVVLPQVMREQGVDMWIVRNDEADKYYNNEGPIYTSMIPANDEGMTLPSEHVGPRDQETPRLMLFHDDGEIVHYMEPKDYEQIAQLVTQIDPNRIAIGTHNNEKMVEAIGEEYARRTIDSWTLGVRWLETALPEQISTYRSVQRLANDIIAEGFSNTAIKPGVTTTEDLNWWFRQKMLDLDIEYENHPSIRVQRKPANIAKYADDAAAFSHGEVGNGISVVIQRGDIISIDADIFMLGLVTDSHQHAYVLEDGETDVPADLKSAIRVVNVMQDKFAAEFVPGLTGKEIVAAANRIPRIDGVVESSLGFHPPPMFIRRYLQGGYMFSHKTYVAGMTSGPGYYPTSIVSNDHKLYVNTLYAFEPHTRVAVMGWPEQGVELGMGQIVVMREDGLEYLSRSQQSEWHVIK